MNRREFLGYSSALVSAGLFPKTQTVLDVPPELAPPSPSEIKFTFGGKRITGVETIEITGVHYYPKCNGCFSVSHMTDDTLLIE